MTRRRPPQFLRGYGLQGSASRGSWGRGAGVEGLGADLKNRLREPGPWRMTLQGYGEMLPRYENYVALDPTKKDRWGIPLLRVHCAWSENELPMREDIKIQAAETLEAAGCVNVGTYDDDSSRVRRPRDGHRPHGARPEDQRPQRIEPELGGPEPLHHRRRLHG